MVRRTSSSSNLPLIQGRAVNPAGTSRRAASTDQKVSGQLGVKGITKCAGQAFPAPIPVSMDDIIVVSSTVMKGLCAFAKAIAKKWKKLKPLLQDARQGIPQQVRSREMANQRRLGSSEGPYEVSTTPALERAARALGLTNDDSLKVDYDAYDEVNNAAQHRCNQLRAEAEAQRQRALQDHQQVS